MWLPHLPDCSQSAGKGKTLNTRRVSGPAEESDLKFACSLWKSWQMRRFPLGLQEMAEGGVGGGGPWKAPRPRRPAAVALGPSCVPLGVSLTPSSRQSSRDGVSVRVGQIWK